MNKVIGRLFHVNKLDAAILEAIERDKEESIKDCVSNLLRQAARGEEWAVKLLCERLEAINNATPKE